jgi:hypothetical protein
MSDRTAVYRFFDADESLLYVGVSSQPEVRRQQHAADKAWWPEVARTDTVWYADRPKALAGEAFAIITERPRYNVILPARDPEAFPPMTVRFPRDVHDGLRRKAFDERKAMNTLVVEAVRKDLGRRRNDVLASRLEKLAADYLDLASNGADLDRHASASALCSQFASEIRAALREFDPSGVPSPAGDTGEGN